MATLQSDLYLADPMQINCKTVLYFHIHHHHVHIVPIQLPYNAIIVSNSVTTTYMQTCTMYMYKHSNAGT